MEYNLNNNTINIILENSDYLYEIEGICRLFFPKVKLNICKDNKITNETQNFLYINIDKNINSDIILYVCININNDCYDKKIKIFSTECDNLEKDIELKLCSMIFEILSKITNICPEWGIITGIRPVKLFRSLLRDRGIEYSVDYFRKKCLVSESKIKLVQEVSKNQDRFLEIQEEKFFSLYISIPFCPSRCSYCSFVSQSVEKSFKLVPVYFDLLLQEIACTANIAKELKLKLQTVYIGGGTPTVLKEFELETLINSVYENFDMSNCKEFTVEAGRPDTLTLEKLKIFSKFKGIRLSINPQTFNDEVLEAIKRRHSSDDTVNSFAMARENGINNINMDLIAGLPKDTYFGFCKTIEKTLDLSPESITIHTLSLKRASNMCCYGEDIFKNSDLVGKMLGKANASLPSSGYKPYYLYRQTNTLGNMENTGWAKEGYEGLYNIFIMEESHSILACGAGAVTKLKNPLNDKIERIFNFKFSYEYIKRFEEIITRKGKVRNFYEEFQ